MKDEHKFFNREHFRSVMITAIPLVVAASVIAACNLFTLPEKDTPYAIQNSSEDVVDGIIWQEKSTSV